MALNVKILTIFPEIFPGFLGTSLTGRALKEGIWNLDAVNFVIMRLTSMVRLTIRHAAAVPE